MPIEVALLEGRPTLYATCPNCERPFVPFMRGQVQRSKRPWWRFWGAARPYCAVICRECKEIIGYE